jgi:hypothetical protein
MKKLLLLLIIIPTIVRSQSISLNSLHREFDRYLTGPKQPGFRVQGQNFWPVELKFKPDSESFLACFAADNRLLLDYIGGHYFALRDLYLCEHWGDTGRLHSVVADSQWRNLYFESLTELMARYLASKQHLTIEGITLGERPKLSLQLLQTFAAKFFIPIPSYPMVPSCGMFAVE